MKLVVYGNISQKVEVDPIDVLKSINVISPYSWIIEKDGKYIQMTEESAGQHSFEMEVGEVTKEIFDAFKAKQVLIDYLKKQK